MQSHDLNVMTGSWDIQDLKNPNSLISNIGMSTLPSNGRLVNAEDIEQAKKTKVPVPKELLLEVHRTVSHYETLGKSRRWIRRYIKRKFNIVEY